jgi:hypothetical protein
MNGLMTEFNMVIVSVTFLMMFMRFLAMFRYFNGAVSINGTQNIKKKKKIMPIAFADLASFLN